MDYIVELGYIGLGYTGQWDISCKIFNPHSTNSRNSLVHQLLGSQVSPNFPLQFRPSALVFEVFVGNSLWSGATPPTPNLMCDSNKPRPYLRSGFRFGNRDRNSFELAASYLRIWVLVGRVRITFLRRSHRNVAICTNGRTECEAWSEDHPCWHRLKKYEKLRWKR